MSRTNRWIARLLILSLTLPLIWAGSQPASPARGQDDPPPVVISEVQTTGGSGNTTQEFIELYNPSSAPIDMAGWRLARRTAAATSDDILLSSFDEPSVIPAWGFFLIAHQDYTNPNVVADLTYSGSQIADNNSVLLYRPDGNGDWIRVDLVGWGSAQTAEGAPFPQNPTANRSIERKALPNSTIQDMVAGGNHRGLGNGYDTNNNATDFVRRVTTDVPDTSNPQNSSSPPEPPCATLTGQLTAQGRSDHSGVEILLWPGENLRAVTDSNGHFTIPRVPAMASEEQAAYTLAVTLPGYLTPQISLNLLDYLDEDGYLPPAIQLPPLQLLAGDLNGDNQINVFDLALVGSHYGNSGPPGAVTGDANGDGVVNVQDLALVAGNFSKQRTSYHPWPATGPD